MLSQSINEIECNIIFAFFTGEEKGRLGSSYFVKNMPVSKKDILCNLNIDGLASFATPNSYICIGCKYSELDVPFLNSLNKLKLANDSIPDNFSNENSYLLSDNYSFAEVGIPSILVYEGRHSLELSTDSLINTLKNYSTNIYHTPFDDLSQNINYYGAAAHTNFLKELIIEISKMKAINWNKGNEFYELRKKFADE